MTESSTDNNCLVLRENDHVDGIPNSPSEPHTYYLYRWMQPPNPYMWGVTPHEDQVTYVRAVITNYEDRRLPLGWMLI